MDRTEEMGAVYHSAIAEAMGWSRSVCAKASICKQTAYVDFDRKDSGLGHLPG